MKRYGAMRGGFVTVAFAAAGLAVGRRWRATALLLALCLAALASAPVIAQDSGRLYELIDYDNIEYPALKSRAGSLDTMFRLLSEPSDVTDIAMSDGQTGGPATVLKRDGTVWLRGADPVHGGEGYYTQLPVSGVTKLSGGYAVLRSDGSIWSWSEYCGDGTAGARIYIAPVPGLPPCADVKVINRSDVMKGFSYVALATNGTLWTWGRNYFGEVGNGSTTPCLSPYQVQAPGLTNIVAIFTRPGCSACFALTADGSVYGWGAGNFCDGVVEGAPRQRHVFTKLSPFKIAALSQKNVRRIFPGGDDGNYYGGSLVYFAQLADGSWLGWGNNRFRKLACNTDVAWYDTPVPAVLRADGTTLPDVISVQAHGYGARPMGGTDMEYALAVTADGACWAWGEGTLITGDPTIHYPNPTRVPWLTDVAMLKMGDSGSYTRGLLVRRPAPSIEAGVDTVYVSEGRTASFPVRLAAAPTANVTVSATASGDSDLTVTSANLTFTPANWDVWQLVTVAAAEDADTLAGTATIALAVVGHLSSVSVHAVEIDNDTSGADTVFAWGANSDGQLGDGTTVNRLLPVRALSGGAKVAGGAHHSLMLDAAGNVWAAGRNYRCQLGDGTTQARLSVVPSLISTVSAIAAGYDASVAVRSNVCYIWGDGYGFETRLNPYTSPTLAGVPGGVTAVAAGFNHELAIVSGNVWSWCGGRFPIDYGQFGRTFPGGGYYATVPGQVTDVSGAVGLAAGPFISAAVLSNGRVMTWGANSSGQLGDGTVSFSRGTAAEVPALSNVIAIATGGYSINSYDGKPIPVGFLLALKSDRTVWAWGDNSNGQLGDGTTSNRLTPVQVVGLSNVTAIAAGASHSLARTLDGRLWAWGNNGSGQLGDGTTTPRATPAQVPGIVSVTAIAAGGQHSLAVGASDAGGAPVAVNDTYTTAANTPLIVPALGVLGNDTGGGALTAVRISTSAHGMAELNADGSFMYMPLSGFSGTDSFLYKVRCGLLESGAALVTITVQDPSNRPPAIVSAAWADPNPVALPGGATAHVVASDPDGDILSYTWSHPSGPGTATFATPGAADTAVSFSNGGVYRLRVTVTDGKGGTVGTVGSDVTVVVTGGSDVDSRADCNHDGVVNALDLQIVIANFGKIVP